MPSLTLRSTLLLDAAASGAIALLALVAADPLGDVFDLPAALLRVSGLLLVPFVALLLTLSRQPGVPRAGGWLVVMLNLLWVAGSVILLAGGWTDPNALGVAFVLAQATAVAIFAALQAAALVLANERRAHGAPA
jgi:hypothetical protein